MGFHCRFHNYQNTKSRGMTRTRRGENSSSDASVTPAFNRADMDKHPLLERETTLHVIAAFFEVYKTLGFGFLEQVYRCPCSPPGTQLSVSSGST